MSVATDPKVALPQALRDVLEKYSASVLKEPARLRNLLSDRCGEHRQEINLLVNALGEGALDHIANAPKGSREEAVMKLGAHLQKQLGTPAETALWVARTWFDLVGDSEARIITMEMFHRAAKAQVTSAMWSLGLVSALVAAAAWMLFEYVLRSSGAGLIAYALVGVGAFKAVNNRIVNLKNAQRAAEMWDPNMARRMGIR